MGKHTKKLLIQSLKLLFSGAIIYWLIQSDKLNFTALKNLLSPGVASVALLLVFLNLFFASERWRFLIESQGIPSKAWNVYKLTLIGSFFNFAMPGGVGGDVVKAFYFSRENPESKVVAVTSVLMDRVLGLLGLVVMALAVMIYDLEHILATPILKTLFIFVSTLFVVFIIALSLVFSTGLHRKGHLSSFLSRLPLSTKLIKLYESMHLYGRNKSRLILVLGLSLSSQLCAIAFLYLAGAMAGYADVPIKTYCLVAPLGFMATAIPISPAGVGVGQAAFYFLFNLYTGHPSELGPTTITAFQVGTFIVSLLGAFFYLRRKDRVQSSLLNQAP